MSWWNQNFSHTTFSHRTLTPRDPHASRPTRMWARIIFHRPSNRIVGLSRSWSLAHWTRTVRSARETSPVHVSSHVTKLGWQILLVKNIISDHHIYMSWWNQNFSHTTFSHRTLTPRDPHASRPTRMWLLAYWTRTVRSARETSHVWARMTKLVGLWYYRKCWILYSDLSYILECLAHDFLYASSRRETNTREWSTRVRSTRAVYHPCMWARACELVPVHIIARLLG